MKKSTNLLITIALLSILIGCIIFVITMFSIGWNFKTLNPANYITNKYEITENFDNIVIDTSTCDIVILPSTNNKNEVEIYEDELVTHLYELKDSTLYLKEKDTRKWYEKIGFGGNTIMKIYLVDSYYNKLNINASTSDIKIYENINFTEINIDSSTSDVEINKCVSEKINILVSTGDIELSNITVNELNLTASTGDIYLEKITCNKIITTKSSTGIMDFIDVSCNNLSSVGSTGDINLTNVLVSGNIEITRSTGDVKFDRCDAENINVTTTTGDVKGTILSDKIFNCETDTGKKQLPESKQGGNCTIKCSTGDIIISIIK